MNRSANSRRTSLQSGRSPSVRPARKSHGQSPGHLPEKRGKAGWWEKQGGGSLSISITLHAVLFLLAISWLVTSTLHKQSADEVAFLPGGGGGQDGQTKQETKRQQKAISQTTRAIRISSTAASANAVSLPDLTATVDLSQTLPGNQVMGGPAGAGSGGGSGGGRGTGTGTGTGSGMGPGAGAGFVSVPSIFGGTGTGGLVGRLYDMKQDRKRKEMPYNADPKQYFTRLYDLAEKRFRENAFNDYYQATVPLSWTLLAVPPMAALEGPKAFQAEKEIQPRGWFIHYHGQIDPPAEGDWRFVGFFDDALLVYVNNRLVLDASWHDQSREEVRKEFGTTQLPRLGKVPYSGKWVSLRRGTTLDILVGERPGGDVGGLLMVQQRNKKYAMRETEGGKEGVPILPIFSFIEPRKEDRERMSQLQIPIADETPIFKISESRFPSLMDSRE